jgi:uncharacterized protein YcfJ
MPYNASKSIPTEVASGPPHTQATIEFLSGEHWHSLEGETMKQILSKSTASKPALRPIVKSSSALTCLLSLIALIAGCVAPFGDQQEERTVVRSYDRTNDSYYSNRDRDETGYRRRPNEPLYEANVTSVRAVLGTPEKRCWVEREEVAGSSKPSVGGAIAGAVIGGILGHQIGSGSGQDVATVGGALAGGGIGANVNRNRPGYGREVERCEKVADSAPEYWDVTYNFRGVKHRVQLTSPPGRTILVNEDGEPRSS